MIRIRRIVCPVDFSEFSRRALERAAVLARWYEAELVALHAAPLVLVSFPLAPGVSQATLELFDVEAMAGELRAFTAEVAATSPLLQVMVRPGAAAPVILDLARGLGADPPALGTHGRSGFRKLVLGSVAENVVRKAPCPVLTVPARGGGPPRQAGVRARPVRSGLPGDLSARGRIRRVIRRGGEWAAQPRARTRSSGCSTSGVRPTPPSA